MINIEILTVGKNKEAWLNEAISIYIKRLKAKVKLEIKLYSSTEELEKQLIEKKALIVLDETGKSYTSEQFSSFIFKELERQGARLSFVIGGAEGFSQGFKDKNLLLSLSKMTFTHQMARLFLAEQIYRAFEIERNSPYHK